MVLSKCSCPTHGGSTYGGSTVLHSAASSGLTLSSQFYSRPSIVGNPRDRNGTFKMQLSHFWRVHLWRFDCLALSSQFWSHTQQPVLQSTLYSGKPTGPKMALSKCSCPTFGGSTYGGSTVSHSAASSTSHVTLLGLRPVRDLFLSKQRGKQNLSNGFQSNPVSYLLADPSTQVPQITEDLARQIEACNSGS